MPVELTNPSANKYPGIDTLPDTVKPPLAVNTPEDTVRPADTVHPLVIVAPPFAAIKLLDVKDPVIAVFPVIVKAFVPGLVYDPTASLVRALYVSPTA